MYACPGLPGLCECESLCKDLYLQQKGNSGLGVRGKHQDLVLGLGMWLSGRRLVWPVQSTRSDPWHCNGHHEKTLRTELRVAPSPAGTETREVQYMLCLQPYRKPRTQVFQSRQWDVGSLSGCVSRIVCLGHFCLNDVLPCKFPS